MKRKRYIYWRDLIEERSASSRKEQFKASSVQRKENFREKINYTYSMRGWPSLQPPSRPVYHGQLIRDGKEIEWEELAEEDQREILAAVGISMEEWEAMLKDERT